MARTETQLGVTTALGTTYTQIGSDIAASTTFNLHLNITNRTTGTAKLRAYVADGTWTTGEPTGGTLKAAIAYDLAISPGEVVQISGIVMATTNALVVRSDTASSLDIIASGVSIT